MRSNFDWGAKSQKFSRGDTVFFKEDQKKNPDNVLLYKLIEKRPDIGPQTWLALGIGNSQEIWIDEDEMMKGEWEKPREGAPKRSNSKSQKPPKRPSAQSASTAPIYDTPRPQVNALGRFLTLTVLGGFTVLSQQVWLNYADTVLAQIKRVPFSGLIDQLPIVDGVFQFFAPWFPDVFGIGVWALINACQSGKHLIKLLDIRDPWWVSMLTDWSQPKYVAIAYIAEVVLNYDRFPLFEGGVNYLIDNASDLDMDLFLWPNVFFLMISVLCFEHLVKFFTPKSARSKHGTTRTSQSI